MREREKQGHWIVLIWIILLALLSLQTAAGERTETDQTQSSASSALMLVYLVGSDLESGNGHLEGGGDGTNDILKMLEGYGDTNPEDLNILVAFGGAAVPGWEGMTIATIADLRKDAGDGVIGNEEIGEYRDASADMGSKNTLQTFLSYARDRYSGNTTYLFFWDHGGGFDGFGWDENTGNHLSVADLAAALKENGEQYDLIGFDACLMSGIEVARSMKPFAHYMLASEEISAGGWSYEKWIPILAENPAQDPTETGRTIIRTFIEQEEPLGNTEALIDLTRLEPVFESLDELGSALDGTLIPESSVLPIARAYEKTTRFGENFGDSPGPGMIDLGTLAQQLSVSVPQAEPAITQLTQALSDAVIYERHDDLVSNATGLSISDPLTVSAETYESAADVLAISPGWDVFVENIRLQMQDSKSSPEMVSVGTNTYQIAEPSGSESVSVVYFALVNGTNEILQLGMMPVEPDENDRYLLPDWSGEWYYLQDSEDPNEVALIDLYYGDTTTTGIEKYISEVDVTRNGTTYTSVMYSYIDPDIDWIRFSLRPYQEENDDIVFARNGFTPIPGDTLSTYASAYDETGNDIGVQNLGAMNITSQLQLTRGILPDGNYGWALMVTSPNGQEDIGEMKVMEIRDGVVTSILSDEPSGSETGPVSGEDVRMSEQNKSPNQTS